MEFFRRLFYVAGIIVNLWIWDTSAGYPTLPSLAVSPSQSSYQNGQKITMICTPPINTGVKGIRYFRNNTEIHCDTKETMTHYSMLISKKESEGVYTCSYWVISNGSKNQSMGSNTVNIVVADTTSFWIYYIAGGIVVVAVSVLSCILYRRTQKKKGPNYRPGSQVKNISSSPLVQNHLSNPIYSVFCENSTPSNKQLSSAKANTRMTDSEGLVPKSSTKSSASVEDFSQVQEEAHIYSEIQIETKPNKSYDQLPSTDSKSSLLHDANITIYYTAHAPPTSSVVNPNLMEKPHF
ncbi:uncharacterized protein [Engystomops pustulosus]|uniref:uncharacterized protein n=1 Tax=Engystomops pustulosus TaxID=76066 RepID=UPI003AFA2FB3